MTAIEKYNSLTIEDVVSDTWWWVDLFYDIILTNAVKRVVASPSSWPLVSKDFFEKIVRRWKLLNRSERKILGGRAYDDPMINALGQCFMRLTWSLFVDSCNTTTAMMLVEEDNGLMELFVVEKMDERNGILTDWANPMMERKNGLLTTLTDYLRYQEGLDAMRTMELIPIHLD